MMRQMAVILCVEGTSNPTAATISIIPVTSTINSLAGINAGSIKAIPFLNLKWPMEVKSNITDIAILPLSIRSAAPEITQIISSDSKKTAIRTTTISSFLYLKFFLQLIC